MFEKIIKEKKALSYEFSMYLKVFLMCEERKSTLNACRNFFLNRSIQVCEER